MLIHIKIMASIPIPMTVAMINSLFIAIYRSYFHFIWHASIVHICTHNTIYKKMTKNICFYLHHYGSTRRENRWLVCNIHILHALLVYVCYMLYTICEKYPDIRYNVLYRLDGYICILYSLFLHCNHMLFPNDKRSATHSLPSVHRYKLWYRKQQTEKRHYQCVTRLEQKKWQIAYIHWHHNNEHRDCINDIYGEQRGLLCHLFILHHISAVCSIFHLRELHWFSQRTAGDCYANLEATKRHCWYLWETATRFWQKG